MRRELSVLENFIGEKFSDFGNGQYFMDKVKCSDSCHIVGNIAMGLVTLVQIFDER